MKELTTRVVQIATAVLLIAALQALEHTYGVAHESAVTTRAAVAPANEKGLIDEQNQLQEGVAISLLDDTRLDSMGLQHSLATLPLNKKYWSFGFQDSHSRVFTYAATAVNKKHYFANSFLLGFVPFETQKIWVPLATLSQRKRYLFDHKLYGAHMQDIWQNSKQAYAYSHGDCEDHAILLADWLIGLGFDAKVALGEVPSGGHAWVVVAYRGTDYVLEATNKRRINSIRDFMVAARATDYRPTILFNREHLWVNTGTPFTTHYRGNQWQLTSRFVRDRTLTASDLSL